LNWFNIVNFLIGLALSSTQVFSGWRVISSGQYITRSRKSLSGDGIETIYSGKSAFAAGIIQIGTGIIVLILTIMQYGFFIYIITTVIGGATGWFISMVLGNYTDYNVEKGSKKKKRQK